MILDLLPDSPVFWLAAIVAAAFDWYADTPLFYLSAICLGWGLSWLIEYIERRMR